MRRRRGFGLLFAALTLAAGLHCTDASLGLLPEGPEPPFDNRLTVEGEVCTQSTEDLVFPLRVLFLVDASESMEITDPPDAVTGETQRERAVRETVADLLDGSGDVKVSVVRFSAQAQPLTVEVDDDGQFASYFTDDLDFALSRLYLLGETDRTTNYIQALSEAYSEVRDELTRADQESLALSTYQVILITDGIPDVEGGQGVGDIEDDILDAVQAIMDLGGLFHVDRVAVNAALISSGNPAVDEQAEDLLDAVADQGEGTFRAFSSGGELNFLFVDLTTLKRVFMLRTLVAQNLNALVFEDEVLPDSDADGLEDAEEVAAGTDLLRPDSDGDGCRDSIEHRHVEAGLDPLDPDDCNCFFPDYCFDVDEDGLCDNGCLDEDEDDLCDCVDLDDDDRCDPENYPDSDGDGLVDCEERWAGTNRRGSDTDGDGLVDFHEIRFGVAPDLDDYLDDLDWDAVPNGEEVRTATDPRHASVVGRYHNAYRYRVTEGPFEPGRTCYDFTVSNITLTELVADQQPVEEAWPAGQGFSGRNRVLLFVGEVPFDDLESYARFRVACVQAAVLREGNFRDPPSGRVNVTDEDFVELSRFDAAEHCPPPGGWR
ncbi:MAG: VWA domain-containing protein [Deltaproteobacteria bacterium]|nr:VWA domain-containing protein [Deltaproteobacteria bacterium]